MTVYDVFAANGGPYERTHVMSTVLATKFGPNLKFMGEAREPCMYAENIIIGV